MFEGIVGNDAIKIYLKRMVDKRAIGNSLLFAGPEGVGKGLFAHAFAKLILGTQKDHHPDIHIYKPEGKIGMHSIDSMRQFNDEVYLAPYESKHKIFIIHDAERMLKYSANALLKTFEEPSLDSVIILVSSEAESLLPTVLSRCRTVHFQPVSVENITLLLKEKNGLSDEKAHEIAIDARGSIAQAVRLAEHGEHSIRHHLLKVMANGQFATYADLKTSVSHISEQLEKTKKELEEETQTGLLRGMGDNLTAVQRQSIEKEVDGAVAMKQTQEARSLFEVILSWYRDLELLKGNGNPRYLINRDYQDALVQRLQRGHLLTTETAQAAVNDALLALQRSTTLNICLENLFLRLNLL